jgi:hypothetical protein
MCINVSRSARLGWHGLSFFAAPSRTSRFNSKLPAMRILPECLVLAQADMLWHQQIALRWGRGQPFSAPVTGLLGAQLCIDHLQTLHVHRKLGLKLQSSFEAFLQAGTASLDSQRPCCQDASTWSGCWLQQPHSMLTFAFSHNSRFSVSHA